MKTIQALRPWTWGKKTGPFDRDNIDTLFPSLYRQTNNLFDEVLRDFDLTPLMLRNGEVASFYPHLDLLETDKNYQVSIELPGMSEKEIDLSFRDGNLIVRGEKKEEYDEKKEHVYQMERSYGAFQRTIDLPVEVDEEGIEATFKKGVLNITLPKTQSAQKEVRQIPVNAA